MYCSVILRLGTRSGEETTVILDNDGEQHLVLFPHTLVSGTTISMGITCQRRAVLAETFKTDGPNAVMILGTFLHELFDFVIRDRGEKSTIVHLYLQSDLYVFLQCDFVRRMKTMQIRQFSADVLSLLILAV